ncbi:transglutaminase TgpA family protein [Streptomyces mangrovisoli]|uniref:Transglutaminase n=1 Tax=Streptomyces mangrovisoli TaxID=1428628 RepID=A0A1J4P2G2_9ACTN|nr:DUF3488 and transglutaminase-like domain-containing protein [Streptomyces mangrovisoli]OIJ68760.1 transglutaminase [Streptomyces mangrovisoli]
MSGRARLTLCAAAATLMVACALLPLVSPATWLIQAAFLVAIQSGTGAAARRVPLGRALTVGVQILVTLVLLTLVFAREYAVVGLVPGPDAFRHFGDLLQQGSTDVGRYAIPAPLSDGIRLMLVGGVLVIGLAVDTLAVTFRSAAPAGLPLLALYAVGAALSHGHADWLWFVVAASGYLMLLLAEGRDRLAQWGRVFGGAPRAPGDLAPGVVAPVRTGRRIGMAALGMALIVPLALPTMGGGLLGTAGNGVGSGTGIGGGASSVDLLVSLQNSLNVDEDRTVLTLATNSSDLSDMYLRIVSLDEFDGATWKPAQRHVTSVPDTFPTPAGLGADVKRAQITTRIAAADSYAQDWLPMPYPPSGVKINGSWRYEPVGMTLSGDHGQTTRGMTYTVDSLDVQPTAEQLAASPDPSQAMLHEYTDVPKSVPSVVAKTARTVTKGARNHYEEAVKLQDYFAVNGGFQYDTDVKVGQGPDAIAKFLKDKRGFCEHFSFAMAAMARTLGIPARVAVGFAPGTVQADGTVTEGLKDAHAWPELYFEGVGWVRFEPTPNRGTVPSYTQSTVPGSTLPDQARPSQSASAAASPAPSDSQSCTPSLRKLDACPSASEQATAVRNGDGPGWWAQVLVALAILAGLAIPLSPMLVRLRMRAVRLGGHGRSEKDAALATLAVWQELSDTAWDFGILPVESQTPRTAAARIVRLGHLDAAAAASVHRVAEAVEQVLYAPRPRPVAGLAGETRQVVTALRTTANATTRLRALLAPRSTVRVFWAVGAWWSTMRPLRVRPAGGSSES